MMLPCILATQLPPPIHVRGGGVVFGVINRSAKRQGEANRHAGVYPVMLVAGTLKREKIGHIPRCY